MAGYPSNLAKKFSPTEQFQQQVLPLLPLYNAQWWGYESLTAIVLVCHEKCHLQKILNGGGSALLWYLKMLLFLYCLF